MTKISNFNKFMNENLNYNINNQNDDFSEIMNILLKVSSEDIVKFKSEMIKSLNSPDVNESINIDFLNNLKFKFRRWFNDKLFGYLINRKKEYYEKLIDKLNIFDLYSLKDVHKNFPTFKAESLYLAGGMDAAKKGGKVGWRNVVEYELEVNRPGNLKNAPDIEIYMGNEGNDIIEIKPSYVVDGDMLDLYLKNPAECKRLYNKPMILNPVRKEVDRNKIDFDSYLRNLKTKGTSQEDIDKAILFFRKTFSKNIIPDDEHLINKSSAIFLGLNPVAGAGTYAELELLSFIEKPLFCVLVEGYENIPGNFKLWNMPQLCKLARNIDELAILIDTIHNDVNKLQKI